VAVEHRDGFTCQKCGTRDVRLVADHIIQIDDGGAPLDLTNGMTLCMACHNRKTAPAAYADRRWILFVDGQAVARLT
jgi:5-methylcytosine-specific restriction enzyme A